MNGRLSGLVVCQENQKCLQKCPLVPTYLILMSGWVGMIGWVTALVMTGGHFNRRAHGFTSWSCGDFARREAGNFLGKNTVLEEFQVCRHGQSATFQPRQIRFMRNQVGRVFKIGSEVRRRNKI